MLNEVEKKTLLCLRKIKWFYSVETQQSHTIIWLRVSVFSIPSSGQYFPVEYTLHTVQQCFKLKKLL
jgi:hypothetical protein